MVDVSGLAAAVARVQPGADSVVALLEQLRDVINADLANDAAAQQVVNDSINALIQSADKIDAALNQTPTP
jgi:hypothetical protein